MSNNNAAHAPRPNTARLQEAKARPETSAARRVADSAHNFIDDAAAKAEEAERSLREKAAVAGEKYEATKESANEQVEQSLAKVENYVRQRPLTAAGIAFAAGIVASSILRR